jgi:hypothetical protein
MLFLIGSCVFGGSDEPKPAPTPISTPTSAPSPTPTGEMISIGSTMLEQAIFDAFPTKPPKSRKAKRTASNAADFIGATINSAGYLCAQVVEARQVAAGQYGIGCRKYRAEGGSSNFIVDVRSGNVNEI